MEQTASKSEQSIQAESLQMDSGTQRFDSHSFAEQKKRIAINNASMKPTLRGWG